MSADADRLIGHGLCPVCRRPGARWSLMRTGRVCVTHNGCCQVMARGDDADQALRDRRSAGGDLHDPAAEAPPVRVPTAATEPPPADPAPVATHKPRWGVMAW